jgi:hypothetical protein
MNRKVGRGELRRLISSAKRVFIQFWLVRDIGLDGQTNLRISRSAAMTLVNVSSDLNVFTVHVHEAGLTKGDLYIENGKGA